MTDCTIEIPEMPPQAIADLVAGLDGASISGDAHLRVRRVVFDSREARAGDLFVALRGGYVDGHRFLGDALGRGAVCALVEPDTPEADVEGYLSVVRVPNTRAALAWIATRYFDAPSASLRVVGITGTDGKTTTSHMVEATCRAAGMRTGLVGTVAVRIGACTDVHESRQTTPESLHMQGYLAAMRAAHVDVAVIEATSHGLAMHRVDGCDFDVGVITNITHEHLDFHGSVEAYRLAKASLLERVAAARTRGKLGAVVLNADDEGVRSVAGFAAGCAVTTFSMHSGGGDIYPLEVERLPGGSRIRVATPVGEIAATLPLPGTYNVANALAAVGACLALGIPPEQIAAGLGSLPRVPGRMEVIDQGQPFTVIVDYAHTPEALSVLLRELRPTTRGRLLVLFGSAGERDVAKRAVQGRIGVTLADFAIFTSEDPRFEEPDAIIEQIAAGAAEVGAKRGVHFDCIEDRASAIRFILERARPGDTVVLAGKGHEHSMIYGAERRPWDEAAQARSALRQLGYDVAGTALQEATG